MERTQGTTEIQTPIHEAEIAGQPTPSNSVPPTTTALKPRPPKEQSDNPHQNETAVTTAKLKPCPPPQTNPHSQRQTRIPPDTQRNHQPRNQAPHHHVGNNGITKSNSLGTNPGNDGNPKLPLTNRKPMSSKPSESRKPKHLSSMTNDRQTQNRTPTQRPDPGNHIPNSPPERIRCHHDKAETLPTTSHQSAFKRHPRIPPDTKRNHQP